MESWTPYPELDAVLTLLLRGSQEVLKDNLLGVYLHGSLAAGDFNPRTSDVDFVVVTYDPVLESSYVELENLLAQLQILDPGWTQRLEGSLMPVGGFAGIDVDAQHPSFDEGKFSLDHKGIYNAMQRHTLREYGIVLTGQEPSIFIAPVSAAELKAETLRVLHGWWKPQLADAKYLRDRGYQAYAVLTMCRMLYTLATGAVASKPAAARWAKGRVDERWHPLIDRASNWDAQDGVDDLAPTQEFITYVLEQTGGS